MQSLFNLKKASVTTVAIAGCMVAFTGGASANSITLSQSGGSCGGSVCGPSTYIVSSTFTVTVFANLMVDNGGQEGVAVSLLYDPTPLTAVACAEAPGGQTVGGGTYVPITPGCGPGSPPTGGLLVPGVVSLIEQFTLLLGTPGTSGTLILGTVTFHGAAAGTTTN